MDWTGKVGIVTGGASGIGEATAREFAAGGAAVAILDVNGEAGEKVAAALRALGGAASFHEVDVADSEACQAAVRAIVAEYGRVDCLVNNAASFLTKGLDATTADWERVLGTNVRGYANMAQACAEPMRDSGGGAIVNLSSISGHVAQPNRWTYNASKGAILALTRCMALDLAPYGIRVNTVSPGWTWTPEVAKAAVGGREKWEPVWGRFSILRRLGEPREVARAILFLCSDDASLITGAELPVDGGYLALGSEGLGDHSTFAGTE